MSGVIATVVGVDWDFNGSFLARYTVNRLGKMGSQVVCAYRGCELGPRHLRVMGDLGQIHLKEFQLLDAASVTSSVKHSNVVINMAMQEYPSRHFSMNDVNVDGARIVARAAAEAGVARFIHVSALGANIDSPSEFLRTKALGEQAVLEEFPTATILRPAVMIGDEDNFLNRLAQLRLIPGPLPLANYGKSLKRPVYVVDVAKAIVNAISNDESAGKTYELVGPKKYSMTEICEYIGTTVREPMWTVGLPDEATPLLRIGFRISQMFRMGFLPNMTEFYRYTIDEDVTKGALGLEDLGVEPTTMESVGIHVLRRYRKHIYHDDIVDDK